jgi:hypothetical protein
MARIVMADDGIAFDGRSAAAGPLGGAETAFVALAEAFAARGHEVIARSNCAEPASYRGVAWAPLGGPLPDRCDLYIGNRGHRVIGLVRRVKRRLFWLHNPARYLKKPRVACRLAWFQPTLVTTGPYHASTVPRAIRFCGQETIPLGMIEPFRHAERREPPPPRAIFTSNPLRGLDWLLDLWVTRIRPAIPQAELHIFAGSAVHREASDDHTRRMDVVLRQADALSAYGVHRHTPVGRDALAFLLTGSRAMLYRGDPGETFCLALAEAQAMGVPAVVQPIGCVAERVVDGETGRVCSDDVQFAEAAVAVLRDDDLWRRCHHRALATQRGLSWGQVAARYETLLG